MRKYFSYVGSYEGAVEIKGKWIRIKNLNYIEKTDWIRHQGPPTKKIELALKDSTVYDARDLFPYLEIKN